MVADGMSNKEIASEFGLSVHSVIRDKRRLGLINEPKRAAGLAGAAARHGRPNSCAT